MKQVNYQWLYGDIFVSRNVVIFGLSEPNNVYLTLQLM